MTRTSITSSWISGCERDNKHTASRVGALLTFMNAFTIIIIIKMTINMVGNFLRTV